MDISVKNALDGLQNACKKAESDQCTEGVWKLAVHDIRSFIYYISDKGAADRFNRFCSIYLDGNDYKELSGKGGDELRLEAYPILCNAKTGTSLYLSFFLELSKYYLHSRYDRKEIDADKVTEYFDYLKESAPEAKLRMSENRKTTGKESTAMVEQTEMQKKKAEDHQNGIPEQEPEESLEELLQQLNGLIGMQKVKDEVNSLINLLKYNQMREASGSDPINTSMHLVFTGNPGTGKTTVARLLSKIYKQIGVLESGQLVEVDRGGLVAGYVGQTAERTNEKINEAMGGILFIDEAYTLAKGGTDFGQEAIDTLLKAMEDNRDKFMVIVAGYPEPMERFLESNPGLRSRFHRTITFEDYNEQELFEIFESICRKNAMTISTDAKEKLRDYLSYLVNHKADNFANGREMRNLFETTLSNKANRLAEIEDDHISKCDLYEINAEEFPAFVLTQERC